MFVCSVEKLLSMCSSSCLPGGGSNTELALHCLHYCQGNTMVILSVCLSVCVLHSVLYRALIPSFSPFLHPSSLTSMHHYSQTLSSFLPSIISFSFFLFLSFSFFPPSFQSVHLRTIACLIPLLSTFSIPLSCAGHTGDAAVLTALAHRRLPLLW